MADRELIAAILTAGMLPTLEIPRSRLEGGRRSLTRGEAEIIERAVDHAFGLYRLVLNGLGVDPRSIGEADAQSPAPADMTRNPGQTSHSPVETEARWEHTRSAVTDPPYADREHSERMVRREAERAPRHGPPRPHD